MEEGPSPDRKGKRVGRSLLAGSAFLIAASLLPGLAAVAIGEMQAVTTLINLATVACGLLSGVFLSHGICTACGGKGGNCPPPSTWPEDDQLAIAAEQPATSVRAETPQPVQRWIERTAEAEAAHRGRAR